MENVREPKRAMEELAAPVVESEASYSLLQLYFLRRLQRLLRLRQEQGPQLNGDGVRLIDRAIYSTYCDAVEAGVTNEAQKLLHRFPVASAGTASEA